MNRAIVLSLLIVSVVVPNVTLAAGHGKMTLYSVADNYPDSKYPRSRYGHVPALYVGNSYDHAQNIWGSERIYIRFNLTEIPKGRIIISATLRLWQYWAPLTNQTYEAHRVLGDWNETTQNWENQPSWAGVVTSAATAPNRTEVTVEWDITSDVKAWYNGEADNYGTMIKAVKEEHAQDASSGFWSRESGQDPVKNPMLIVALRGDPSVTYVIKLGVTGLPSGVASTITVDGQPYGSVSPDAEEEIAFDKGTAHTITVSQLLSGLPGTRYRCEGNQANVTAASSYVFTYTGEYLIEFSTDPSGMFETPPTGWYPSGASLPVRRTGPDLIPVAPGARLVFEGWYLNSKRLPGELGTIIVDGPTTLEGHYKTEYYVNVTSSIGKTEGSGWYAKDSVVSFSIDKSTIGAEGLMGLLGLKRSLSRWIGSDDFSSAPVGPQGSVVARGPTTIEAVWQDDWSIVFTNLMTILLGVIAAVAIIMIRRRRRGLPSSVIKNTVEPN